LLTWNYHVKSHDLDLKRLDVSAYRFGKQFENMKNQILRDLNFKTLLGYPNEFHPRNRYDNPIYCDGFCVECEECGTLAEAGGKLTRMSHGCDTDDFEKVLGTKVCTSDAVETHIMFLLEDPGGDYDLGEKITFHGIVKEPPVKHYYWSPSLKSWPQSIEDMTDNYGSYFAYIMQKHSLANVYITNLVKCKRVDVQKPWLVEEKCVSHFLEKEMKEFSPGIVFCFSWKVFNSVHSRFPKLNSVYLRHPAARMSRNKLVSENDELITDALGKLKHSLPTTLQP